MGLAGKKKRIGRGTRKVVGECGQNALYHDENVMMEMIVCNECVNEIGLFGLFVF